MRPRAVLARGLGVLYPAGVRGSTVPPPCRAQQAHSAVRNLSLPRARSADRGVPVP
jgi:hypothetical protein